MLFSEAWSVLILAAGTAFGRVRRDMVQRRVHARQGTRGQILIPMGALELLKKFIAFFSFGRYMGKPCARPKFQSEFAPLKLDCALNSE